MRQHASNHAALCKLRRHFLGLWHNFHRRTRPDSAALQTSHPAQQRTKQSRPRQNRRNHRPVFLLQHKTSPDSPYFCPSTSKSNTPPPIRHPSRPNFHLGFNRDANRFCLCGPPTGGPLRLLSTEAQPPLLRSQLLHQTIIHRRNLFNAKHTNPHQPRSGATPANLYPRKTFRNNPTISANA